MINQGGAEISSSGNTSLRQTPRETLAGRAKYLHLTGFAYREITGLPEQGILNSIWNGEDVAASSCKNNFRAAEVIWRGSLPGIALASNDKSALERLSSYVDTYIQRDIQDLVKIRHPQNFRRLMEVLAQATGWESVQEELSKECGETRTNVSRYISLLKETKLLYELKGYTIKGERAYKQSKYYWFDSGTACFLAGIYGAAGLNQPHLRGRYFENFILQQILSWSSLQVTPPEILYWKSKTQNTEIDFVVLSAGRGIGMEVKASEEITFGDTKTMREFLKAHPQISKGIIVYGGNMIYPVATNIYAVPWMAL